jgi:tetratricopeptide (TPR) repeat protein
MKRAGWFVAAVVVFATLTEVRGQDPDGRRFHGRFADPIQAATAGPPAGQPPRQARGNPYPIGYLVGPVIAGPLFAIPVVPVSFWTPSAPIVIQPAPIVLMAAPQPGGLNLLNADRLALLPGANANLGPLGQAPALGAAPANGNPANPGRPGKRAPAKKAPAPEARKPAEPPPLPGPGDPLPDPRKESQRLVRTGQEAFQVREYARAEQRFADAIQFAGDRALNYFLLAEAQLAQGKYREAFDSIQSGPRLEPAWPSTRFQPRRLYGLNQADFARQLQELRQALQTYPDDLILIFLSAYRLWFDDQRDEARVLFQRAAALDPDLNPSKPFLQPVPYLPLFSP